MSESEGLDRLIAAEQDERRRLALFLHDGPVQELSGIALMVDGAPFLILGGQANNSSNYPAALGKVWPAIADMKANTLVMPVAWEQIEPTEGKFDFSFVDTLVKQAREHNVRLGILWFGTWKNTGPNYTPAWVKLDNKRFPRLTNKVVDWDVDLSGAGEHPEVSANTLHVALAIPEDEAARMASDEVAR